MVISNKTDDSSPLRDEVPVAIRSSSKRQRASPPLLLCVMKYIWPVAVKQMATLIHEVHMVIIDKTDGLSSSSLSDEERMASRCETDGHSRFSLSREGHMVFRN
jgi:hypothetical protein